MNTGKIKRSLTMGLLLLMAAVTATAQNIWSIKDTTVQSGQTVTIELALENKDAITTLQFDLEVPEGLELGDGVQLNSGRINGHSLAMNTQADGSIRFVVAATNTAVLVGNSGTLISLPITISKTFESGKGLSMKNIVMSNAKGEALTCTTELGKIYVKDKKQVKITVSGLEQRVNDEKAATVTITTEPTSIKNDVKVEYYSDEACTNVAGDNVRKKAGVYYVVVSYAGTEEYEAYSDTFTMVVNNKIDVNFGIAGTEYPTAAPILQGQHLSASILTGGKAWINESTPLPGSFAWTNGNDLVTTTGLYHITFTPDDQANYNLKDTTIKLTVIPVYTVYVSNVEHGTISAKGLNSNNQYAEGEELFLTAMPAANYQFVKWSNGATTDTVTWKVNSNKTISAVFEPIVRKVTINAGAGGKLTVGTAADGNISSGSSVQQGKELIVTVTPNESYRLASLKLNGEDFTSGKYILGTENVTISATFAEIENEYPVTVTGEHGVVRLYKGDGTAIPSGTAMKDGDEFQVMALANAGYEFDGLTINGKTVSPEEKGGQVFKGSASKGAKVEAKFKPKKFKVSRVDIENGKETKDDKEYDYGSSITIEKPEKEGYNVSVIVNGRPVEKFPAKITIGGNTNITTVYKALTPIKNKYIINAVQSYIFNNQNKQFFIRTTQTHVSDFDITYKKENASDTELTQVIPVKAGTYSMRITRPADNIYAAYDSKEESPADYFDGKLEIRKGKLALVTPPDGTDNNKGELSNKDVECDVETEDIKDKEGMVIGKKYTYKSRGKHEGDYEDLYYYHSSSQEKCTLNTSNMLRSTAEPKGYVRVSNGGWVYEPNAEIPVGTTITVEAVPSEGYKFKSWSGRSEQDQSIEVLVEKNMSLNFVPVFEEKRTLTASLTSATTAYTGEIQEVSLATTIENAQIGIYKDAECTQAVELKNVGDYYIRVYSPATDEYNEVRDTLTYTITQATPIVEAPTTTEIAEGETLTQVQLLGGSAGSVPGTFSWKDSTTVVKVGTNTYTAIFTSADPNYQDMEVNVSVVGLSVTKSINDDPDPTPEPDPEPDPDPDPTPDPEPDPNPTPDTPTGVEEIASETLLVVQKGALVIYPCVPVEVSVISINGKYIFQNTINGVTTVRVPQAGVYVVSFMKDGKRVARKVNVL